MTFVTIETAPITCLTATSLNSDFVLRFKMTGDV